MRSRVRRSYRTMFFQPNFSCQEGVILLTIIRMWQQNHLGNQLNHPSNKILQAFDVTIALLLACLTHSQADSASRNSSLESWRCHRLFVTNRIMVHMNKAGRHTIISTILNMSTCEQDINFLTSLLIFTIMLLILVDF